MFSAPPELIILELENGHVFAYIEILHFLIFVPFPNDRVGVVHHLMQLHTDFIFYPNLAGVVGSPTIQQPIGH